MKSKDDIELMIQTIESGPDYPDLNDCIHDRHLFMVKQAINVGTVHILKWVLS